MAQVRGIGGIFFKSKDPQSLYAWYEEHLGIKFTPGQGASFPVYPIPGALTAWSIFPSTTTYLKDSKAEFMINYLVDDLASMLDQLRAAGVAVDDHTEFSDFGNFGWITDPDGNRIELWEPKVAPTLPEIVDYAFTGLSLDSHFSSFQYLTRPSRYDSTARLIST